MDTMEHNASDRHAAISDAREVLARAVEAWPDCRANLYGTQRQHAERLRIAICCNDLDGIADESDAVRIYLGETCAECGEETGRSTGKRDYCSRECWASDGGDV